MKRPSLNHAYRLVWNDATQAYVAVAETTRARGKRTAGAVLLATVLASGAALAQLPTGGEIVAGSGSISQSGTTLTITQDTAKLAANWQSFSIGQGHTVNFVQPSASAVALNRVLGSDISVIQGALNANGQVFLVNPNGVLFTPTAQVNVGGLVASTLDLNTADFLAGTYRFEGISSNAIVNQGNITAASGGTVALIAAKITNQGNLTAEKGNVLIGAGNKVTLDLGGPVKIQVEEGALNALIEQGGAIKADGGLVYLTAKAAGDLVTTVINHTGITEAQTLATGESGEIYLMGDMHHGRIEVAGTLDASAPNGGDGGFIETSAANVQIQPGLVVTTQAEDGKTGKWLIDPNDYTVAASGGDITGAQLSANLASTSITIQSANGATNGNGDIFVNDAITWSSGNILLLRAIRNIEINAPIDASQGSGGILGLAYGLGAPAAGNTATYTINAPVSLQSGVKFATAFGSDGPDTYFTVVNSQADLQAMTLTGNYALGSSLTFTGNWTPIGNDWTDCTAMFCGNLDGLGNTIRNLNTTGVVGPYWGEGHGGLFGATLDATIRNLNLENATVNLSGLTTPSALYIGTLIGVAERTRIHNVKATGSVTAPSGKDDYTGGLVGYTYGPGSLIDSSHVTVDVVGGFSVGGLLGYSATGSVTRSSASGSVSHDGTWGFAGGLVGYNDASIQDSYALGSVTGTRDVGGLVGQNYTGGTIVRAYATGAVSGGIYRGGLIGDNSGAVTNGFWDINTTGQVNGVGNGSTVGMVPLGTGISDGIGGTYDRSPYGLGDFVEGVHTYGTFDGANWIGFDFANTWWMVDGATRPFLRSEWRQNIANAHELQLVGMKPTLSYTLANDIDLAPALNNQSEMWQGFWNGTAFQGNWSPIADWNNAFSGRFDGNNKTIFNLSIWSDVNTRNYGLFDTVRDGTVKNLTLSDGIVVYYGNSDPKVGALAGKVLGGSTISHVTSNLDIEGYNNVGGLIGVVEGDDGGTVTISHSSSSGDVYAGGAGAGGLVGDARDFSITNSHATGDVESEYYVGGLVGYASVGSISHSYATGIVTSVEEAGGLVGTAVGVSISDSYATGDVVSDADGYSMGGLVGLAESNTTITRSYATGNVTVTDDAGSVGGLVGYADGTSINQSYATGNVTVGDNSVNVGGLVGKATGGTTISQSYATGRVVAGDNSNDWSGNIGGLVGYVDGGSVDQSYATGSVTAGDGARRVGGLLGQFYGDGDDDQATYQVTNSHATGSVTVGENAEGVGGLIGSAEYSYVANTYAVGAVTAGTGSTDVGGLFGFNDGTVVSSYWNIQTSGQTSSAGGMGKTTAQMKDIATFSGWDIEDDQTLDDSNPYPRLTMTDSGPVWKIKSVSAGGGGGDSSSALAQEAAIQSAQNAASAASTPGTNLLSPPGGDGAAPFMSGGLTFIDIPTGQEAGAGAGGGGFVPVYVVEGGINRTGQARSSAGQYVGDEDEDPRNRRRRGN